MESQNQVLDILQDLIRICSPSEQEKEIADYIERYLVNEGWHVDRDATHTIAACPADMQHAILPLLNAHMDTYSSKNNGLERRAATPEELQTITLQIDADGQVVKADKAGNVHGQIQVGFDDKIGVAMILWLVKYRKDLSFKVLLTTIEERKQVGVRHFLGECNGFFSTISWGFSLDRAEDALPILKEQSGRDIVFIYGKNAETQDDRHMGRQQICSEEFVETIEQISATLDTPMQRERSDNWSDACHIHCQGGCMNIVNLSVGYSYMHRVNDTLDMKSAMQTLNLVQECLDERWVDRLARIPRVSLQ